MKRQIIVFILFCVTIDIFTVYIQMLLVNISFFKLSTLPLVDLCVKFNVIGSLNVHSKKFADNTPPSSPNNAQNEVIGTPGGERGFF